MKKISFTIKSSNIRKETKEERLRRVTEDQANKHAVFRNKKKYNRNNYKKFDYSY